MRVLPNQGSVPPEPSQLRGWAGIAGEWEGKGQEETGVWAIASHCLVCPAWCVWRRPSLAPSTSATPPGQFSKHPAGGPPRWGSRSSLSPESPTTHTPGSRAGPGPARGAGSVPSDGAAGQQQRDGSSGRSPSISAAALLRGPASPSRSSGPGHPRRPREPWHARLQNRTPEASTGTTS